MKYVKFKGGNGYCGCDYEEYEKFPDTTTEKELENLAHEKGVDNAESYATYSDDIDCDDYENGEEYLVALEEARTSHLMNEVESSYQIITKEEYLAETGKE